MQILGDTSNQDDLELILYSMILINTVLNSIPDQDTFYDISDSYEEQGMQGIIKNFIKNQRDQRDENGLYKQIVQQMELYEVSCHKIKIKNFNNLSNTNHFNQAALQQEDGDDHEELNSSFSSNSTTSSNLYNRNATLNSSSVSGNSSLMAPNLR
jgi:hypothetical protein